MHPFPQKKGNASKGSAGSGKQKKEKKVGGRYCGFKKISDLCTPETTAGLEGITRDTHTTAPGSGTAAEEGTTGPGWKLTTFFEVLKRKEKEKTLYPRGFSRDGNILDLRRFQDLRIRKRGRDQARQYVKNSYNGEFDPGSG